MTASIAKVTEISAMSSESFQDAIESGVAQASKTLRNVKSAWIKEQSVSVDDSGAISEYRVNMLVTFVLED